MTTLICVLGAALSLITHNTLKRTIHHSYEAIAIRAAREVSLFISRPVEVLSTAVSLMGKIPDDSWEQETLLVEMSLNFPMFEEIISVSRKGDEIASSNPGHPKKTHAATPAFREAIAGKTYVSEIRIEQDYLPHVTLAVPYYHQGEVTGTVLANVNLRGLWAIVDAIRVGNTGRAFLTSRQGLLLAHPDKKLVLQNTDYSSHPLFPKILSSSNGSLEFGMNEEKDYLASYASVEGALPLILILEVERKEAYQLLNQMHVLVGMTLLLSLAASMAVGFLLARWLVRPVKALQHWSRRVALGDFDYRIPPASMDELGRLFIRFRRMSERLKRAKERERLVALGEAASTISHKLKNSIVSLKTFAQLFPQRKTEQQFLQKFERDFPSTVEYLEKTFKNLAQVASSREPQMESIDLISLFRAVQLSYDEMVSKQRIDFRVEIDPGLPPLEGDPEQLQELIDNLIQNSIQSMPHGGALTLRATYKLQNESDERPSTPVTSFIEISISDNGIGIPQENLGRVFKPFFTTKHGGMGLGLSICKKIVENHHGVIAFVSRARQGTVFRVRLPLSGKRNEVFS